MNYPEPILDQVIDFLITQERGKPEAHYPSNAYKCGRQLWYQWKETSISNPISAAAMLRIQYGISIHEGFIDILKRMGRDMLNEMRGEKRIEGLKYPIRFRVDFLEAMRENEIIGGEVKSTYGRGVKELQESGSPRAHDLPQLATYAYCTGIPWWRLIYLGRDDAYYTEFLCQYLISQDILMTYQIRSQPEYGLQETVNMIKNIMNKEDAKVIQRKEIKHGVYKLVHQEEYPDMMKNVIQKFHMLENALNYNIPPEREFNLVIKNGEAKNEIQLNKVKYRSDWMCSLCSYRDTCWTEEYIKYANSSNIGDMK